MLTAAEPGQEFVLLGTSGIGKSLFTLFGICYLAILKEKVIWQIFKDKLYLLDFSKEDSPKVSVGDNGLQRVFDDPNAWLIIDGGQPDCLYHACHILVACSVKRDNYMKYSKGNAQIRYVLI